MNSYNLASRRINRYWPCLFSPSGRVYMIWRCWKSFILEVSEAFFANKRRYLSRNFGLPTQCPHGALLLESSLRPKCRVASTYCRYCSDDTISYITLRHYFYFLFRISLFFFSCCCCRSNRHGNSLMSLVARFMGPTLGPSGAHLGPCWPMDLAIWDGMGNRPLPEPGTSQWTDTYVS